MPDPDRPSSSSTPASEPTIADLIAELEKLPGYTIRTDKFPIESYSDPYGQWFMWGDLKRIIDRFRPAAAVMPRG